MQPELTYPEFEENIRQLFSKKFIELFPDSINKCIETNPEIYEKLNGNQNSFRMSILNAKFEPYGYILDDYYNLKYGKKFIQKERYKMINDLNNINNKYELLLFCITHFDLYH